MSFTSWLRHLRSVLAPIRMDRKRPRLELLEDRCLLSFTSAASYPAGTSPQAVLTADFNGDGKLDLAVVNYDSSTVSVLLGEPDGTFQPALTFATGANPQSLAVGDFNGDHQLDLVTANATPNANGSHDVSVLLGDGDGNFQAPTSVAVNAASSPTSVAVGDFNADGKMDLGVTSNVYYSGTPPTPGYWYYQYGNYYGGYYGGGWGGGSWNYHYGNPGSPPHNEGRANVLLGNGDGSFSETLPATDLGYGSPTAGSVAVGDFNADGKLDLGVTANATTGGSWGYWGNYYPGYNVSYANVVLGNGDGSFSWPHSSWLGDGYHTSVAVADFNGDTLPDFAAASPEYVTVSVLLGNGSGYFNGPTDFSAGNNPSSVAAGDLNRDGRIDLVTANLYGDNVSALLGDGDGTFQLARDSAAGANPQFVTVGDFNGDLFPDVAVANSWSSGVSVLLNDAVWHSFQISGFPSSATAGEVHTITVTALNNADVWTGYTGTVHFSSSDGQAVLPIPDYTFTASDNGTHTFTVTLKTAGTQWLTVTDTTTPDLSARQEGIVVNPAAASTFVVNGFASPHPVGVAGYFNIAAYDAYGNWIPAYTGTVHFTSSDASATLPAPYTFTGYDYSWRTFSATFWTAGTQSLTVTDTTAATGTRDNIEVTTASRFVVSAPSSVAAGAAANFSVSAVDDYGNLVPGYRGTVHFSSSDAAATLPGNYAFTNGVLTFTATLGTAGTQSLTVTDTVNSSITGSQAGIRVVPVASVTGPSAGIRNQTLTFTLGAGGMPAGTVFSYAIDWNGDGSVDQTVSGPSGVTIDHAYAASGNYNLGVAATVHIGTQDYTSNVLYKYVTVSAVSVTIQTDPVDATKKALVVEGTASADTLVLSPGTGNGVAVSINGTSVGTFTAPGGVPFAHLLVYGYGGSDTLRLSGGLTVPAFLFGGDGNDTLDAAGTTANNVLVGGANTDALTGGSGRDLLIGGLGSDALRGGGGDDILIGGFTDYDANLTALSMLMTEWGRTDADYATRVKHLSGTLGGGLNGSYLLTATTVHTVYDDAASDNMWGEPGLDWFFTKKPPPGRTKDKVNDQSTGETVTALS